MKSENRHYTKVWKERRKEGIIILLINAIKRNVPSAIPLRCSKFPTGEPKDKTKKINQNDLKTTIHRNDRGNQKAVHSRIESEMTKEEWAASEKVKYNQIKNSL